MSDTPPDVATAGAAVLSAVAAVVTRMIRRAPPALPPSSHSTPTLTVDNVRALLRDELERSLAGLHMQSGQHVSAVGRIDGHIVKLNETIHEHDGREIESLRILDAVSQGLDVLQRDVTAIRTSITDALRRDRDKG